MKSEKPLLKHRAVVPVIAALLLISISVVGGTIVFVVAQDSFSTSQISGGPTIELIKILGYDARDVSKLTSHNGLIMATTNSGGDGDGSSEKHERITVHVINESTNPIIIAELLFGGTAYTYAATDTLDAQGPLSNIAGKQFDMLLKTDGITDIMITKGEAEIKPGEELDIILGLDSNFKTGRDVQFRLSTAQGSIFVGSIVIGSTGESWSTSIGGLGGGGGGDDDDDDD